MLFSIICLASIATLASSVPVNSPLVLHEERHSHSQDASFKFLRTRRVNGETLLPVRIALKQRNLDHGYDHLMAVSHPSSPKYGQHWTADQVQDVFAPHESSVQAVKSWLEHSAGLHEDEIVMRNGWIAVDVTAREAERLFNTKYFEQGRDGGNVRVGCDRYYLPKHIAEHVDFVRPGVALSPPMEKRTKLRRRQTSEEQALNALTNIYASELQNVTAFLLDIIANKSSEAAKNKLFQEASTLWNDTDTCGAFITPLCLQALYDLPQLGTTPTDPSNALGLFESDGQLWNQEDLNSFFATVLRNATDGTHPDVVSINGAIAEGATQYAGGEMILDLTIAYSIIYPQTVTVFQSQGTAKQNATYYQDYAGYEALLDAIDASYCDDSLGDAGADCGSAQLTRVFSSSYGIPEIYLPERQSVRMCNEFMKLSLQGHTILGSSGDYGVASHPYENTTGCIDPNHPRAHAQNGTVFNPQFPVDCPYVLAVGATQLDPNATVMDPEVTARYPSEDNALHQGSTGGGFSNYFSQPSYQSSAVEAYFADHDPGYLTYTRTNSSNSVRIGADGGLYNRGGRGFPDVSANGNNWLDFVANEVGFSGGTSMSTPLWGSIITLINEERTAIGKGPVGFVQPVLYEHPEIFNDITSGSTPGCGTNGFTAVQGWDPLSGLGTPNYPKLLEIFLSLP